MRLEKELLEMKLQKEQDDRRHSKILRETKASVGATAAPQPQFIMPPQPQYVVAAPPPQFIMPPQPQYVVAAPPPQIAAPTANFAPVITQQTGPITVNTTVNGNGGGRARPQKDLGTAYAACIIGSIFGICGAHRCYLNDCCIGCLQFWTFGGCIVWAVIDLIRMDELVNAANGV